MAVEIKKAHVEFIGKYTVKITNLFYSKTFYLKQGQDITIDLLTLKPNPKGSQFYAIFHYLQGEDCHIVSANYKQGSSTISCDKYMVYNGRKSNTFEAKLEC